MPKITYLEFRPGKWVKLADGKIVGPATVAEVAAWKQEKAAPIRIWEDVVKTAKPPTLKPVAPAGPTARKEPDPSAIWDDILKSSKPPVKAEGPPAPRPRKEDTDAAEQAQIWQDVVKRIRKPGRELGHEPAAEAKAKPEQKVPLAREAVATKTAPKPAPPARPATEARTKPTGEVPAPTRDTAKEDALPPTLGRRSITKQELPAKPAPAPKVPAAKAVAKETVAGAAPAKEAAAKPTEKAQAAAKVTAPKKAATTGPKPSKPTQEAKPPAEPEIPEKESTPAEPAEETAARPARTGVNASRSDTEAGAASLRRTKKARAAEERPNPLYLWIIATQSDDLLTTVRTGLARYQERFSHPAEVVLCHSGDLPALEGARLPIDLREGKSLAPRNFWIGLK